MIMGLEFWGNIFACFEYAVYLEFDWHEPEKSGLTTKHKRGKIFLPKRKEKKNLTLKDGFYYIY